MAQEVRKYCSLVLNPTIFLWDRAELVVKQNETDISGGRLACVMKGRKNIYYNNRIPVAKRLQNIVWLNLDSSVPEG